MQIFPHAAVLPNPSYSTSTVLIRLVSLKGTSSPNDRLAKQVVLFRCPQRRLFRKYPEWRRETQDEIKEVVERKVRKVIDAIEKSAIRENKDKSKERYGGPKGSSINEE